MLGERGRRFGRTILGGGVGSWGWWYCPIILWLKLFSYEP